MEIKQFVVVTDDPEFCLGTTLLYIDTRNNYFHSNFSNREISFRCILKLANGVNLDYIFLISPNFRSPNKWIPLRDGYYLLNSFYALQREKIEVLLF